MSWALLNNSFTKGVWGIKNKTFLRDDIYYLARDLRGMDLMISLSDLRIFFLSNFGFVHFFFFSSFDRFGIVER